MKTPHRGSFLFRSEKVQLTQHFVIPRELPGYMLVFHCMGEKNTYKMNAKFNENIDKMKSVQLMQVDFLPETDSLHLQMSRIPKRKRSSFQPLPCVLRC